MEIEQQYPSQQIVSLRHTQQPDMRRCVSDVSSLDNSVASLIEWLEANYYNLKQICSSEQSSSQKYESQEQILVRIIKDQLSRARSQYNMSLNFYQLDVQPALMERVILSINQLSHLKTLKINLSRQNWGQDQVQALCNQLIYCRSLRDLDIDLGLNCVSDRGHEILSETLSNLEMLESININLERNGLQRRSISILEIFNKLKQIQQFSLNLDGNRIEIEDEMKTLLPKFKSENIFANVKSIEIKFNEYQPKKSSSNTANQDINGSNGISGDNQIQGLQNQDQSNYNNFVAGSQHYQINQSIHSNNRQLDQSNQLGQQQNNISQNSAVQQQQLQQLQQNIALQQQQLQQLHQYTQQMIQRGFPQNHPQYIQVVTQMQQLQVNIQQNMQMSKNIASKATALKKKSVISRLLEIMLKFTHNLEEFTLACPGQLIDSACWEYFAELIKIKADKLKKFHFAGLNSNTKNQDMEYFFYQMAKLKNLSDFSLSLHNLSAQNGLHLDRFLKALTKLEKVHIDLSSPDSFSNQREVYKDLCNFINNTGSTNIKSLDLNISNSQIDTEIALALFQGIAKMRNLSNLKLNMQSCEQVNDKTIQYLCQALLYQKNIKQLFIDIAYSNFTPVSVQNLMQTLILLKDNLISLQLNITNRGDGFINFNNNIINDTVSQLTNLKKCVISSLRNPKIRIYREKAQEVNRMIKLCSQVKKSNALQCFRKEIAFEVLQFLIQ